MTEQQVPSVVPYVEHYSGGRRVLTLVMTSTATSRFQAPFPPIVSIDGRDYWVYWGQVSFEIPADRACHVSVRCEGGQRGVEHSQDLGHRVASVLLPPGTEPLVFYYQCYFGDGIGRMSPTPIPPLN